MIPPTTTHRRERTLVLFLFGMVLLDRLLLLIFFGTQRTGTDDLIFWVQATDMAHGRFMAPFLYGQDYNPPLESLLAVPLLWAKVPHIIAMPVTTSLLASAPFLSFALWHFRAHRYVAAMAFLAMPLMLPTEWGMMTTITRGFVTGIAIIALLPWIYTPNRPFLQDALTGAALLLAVVINPNAIIFAAPYAVWYFLRSPSKTRTLLAAGCGALPLVALYLLAQHWYSAGPGRSVHTITTGQLSYTPQLISEALDHLDVHFAWTAPLSGNNGSIGLLLLLLIGLMHFRRQDRLAAIVVLLSPLFILATLGLAKVHDGLPNVFFPLSRMYLALPLLMAWALTAGKKPLPRVLWVLLPLLALTGSVWNRYTLDATLARSREPHSMLPVFEVPRADLESRLATTCNAIAEVHPELLVCLNDHDGYTSMIINYGLPACRPDLPPTLFMSPDRRQWRRDAERTAHHHRILIIGAGDDQLAAWEKDGIAVHSLAGDLRPFHVIEAPHRSTDEVLRVIRAEIIP